GENIRVFPISNWTELDVWRYIAKERLAVPSIYYAHNREVVRRNNGLLPISELVQAKAGERGEILSVRFRTVGDMTCTCPVESTATTVDEIIAETAVTRVTERGATRMDDQQKPRWSCAKRKVTSSRSVKKAHLLRCARSPRSNVLDKYASARRFLARLASKSF